MVYLFPFVPSTSVDCNSRAIRDDLELPGISLGRPHWSAFGALAEAGAYPSFSSNPSRMLHSTTLSRMRDLVKGKGYATTAASLTALLWFFATAGPVAAQEAEMETPTRLALFLDCDFCDETFIRQEMPYLSITFSDRDVADVHVLITSEDSTESGGEAQTFDVIGLRACSKGWISRPSLTLAQPMPPTDSEERNGLLRNP